MTHLLLTQLLCTLAVGDGTPVRCGLPAPAAVLTKGLRVEARGDLAWQWRPLQERPDPRTGRVWIELAVVGLRGRAAVRVGGRAAAPPAGGAAFTSARWSASGQGRWR